MAENLWKYCGASDTTRVRIWPLRKPEMLPSLRAFRHYLKIQVFYIAGSLKSSGSYKLGEGRVVEGLIGSSGETDGRSCNSSFGSGENPSPCWLWYGPRMQPKALPVVEDMLLDKTFVWSAGLRKLWLSYAQNLVSSASHGGVASLNHLRHCTNSEIDGSAIKVMSGFA